MKYKIIVDSSSDMLKTDISDPEVGFAVVPLVINVGDKEYIDDGSIDCEELLSSMHAYKGKSLSACPSPQSFYKACDAEYNFIITITAKLSGTYNSACLAKNMLVDKKCFVIDSKATSGTITLLAYKILELIKAGKSYDEICQAIIEYRDTTKFFFVLDDFDNLIKNGRMHKITATIARFMLIKPLCSAYDGDIRIYKKVRTRKQALMRLVEEISAAWDESFKDKECIISHCMDKNAAEYIAAMLEKNVGFKKIIIRPTTGLCSFYALEKGILVAY